MDFSIADYLKESDFDPFTDKIAVLVNEFELKKNPDWPFRYSEPYIVSMAIDQGGANNPSIDFNILPFPKVKKGDVITFDGQGHLIYGPANPGEFVAYTVLFMESDKDIRNLGNTIEGIIKIEAVQIGMKELLSTNPSYSTASMLLLKLAELIASTMKKNKDDELYRRNGTLLRDTVTPFEIATSFDGGNDFIRSKVTVIPLSRDLPIDKDTIRIKL